MMETYRSELGEIQRHDNAARQWSVSCGSCAWRLLMTCPTPTQLVTIEAMLAEHIVYVHGVTPPLDVEWTEVQSCTG